MARMYHAAVITSDNGQLGVSCLIFKIPAARNSLLICASVALVKRTDNWFSCEGVFSLAIFLDGALHFCQSFCGCAFFTKRPALISNYHKLILNYHNVYYCILLVVNQRRELDPKSYMKFKLMSIF